MRREISLQNGKNFWVESFTGEVLDAKTWSETTVSSRQNPGYVHSSGVMIGGGTSVTSKTTEKREIWLKLEDGTDKCFNFTNMQVQALPGHKLTIVKSGRMDAADGPYLAIHQHSTGMSWNFGDSEVTNLLYQLGVFSNGLRALRIFIYIMSVCAYVGIIGAPASALYIHFKRKPIKAEFKQKFAATLPTLLPARAPAAPAIAAEAQPA